MKKKLALVTAVLSGVYLFVPEPSDLIPIVGWLDEGMALAMLGWALSTLGITPARLFRARARVAGAPELSA
ncbi:MAG: hypothetical protein IT383_10740 [Deltaproteobacteria bacterium]|nr:hypothetical protein [Deltaproteobacteria bacterium]